MRGLTLVLLFLGQVILSEVPGFIESSHGDIHQTSSFVSHQASAVTSEVSQQVTHNDQSNQGKHENHSDEKCALHCVCHHISMPFVILKSEAPSKHYSNLDFRFSFKFYLDPVLDPWLRPPLSA